MYHSFYLINWSEIKLLLYIKKVPLKFGQPFISDAQLKHTSGFALTENFGCYSDERERPQNN